MAKNNIKALALAPMAGFRKKEVSVPEWGGEKVIVREPSAEGWIRWQSLTKTEGADNLTDAEKVRRDLRADASLFIDVLLGPDLQPVFTVDESEEVERIYGPVHSRLLKQALALVNDTEEVKAK